ncbi:DNA-deoxyinosine glycosylase [Pseudomethylobacillus aquaticus]|uniref:DNA-deoxyinosine glycosylase n=1 Tax=Pseudomethylobacillus aquaticus TaxID=2676064 RepID=A0A3N0V6N8_9PROT|nr:DNA-deoxyinosine glycosylase [Pseudomethylobacillus aquaticus]ROH88373.1 DNA-deoxyinosine glycosylase [Pseudomethylobacillus aquaticus]
MSTPPSPAASHLARSFNAVEPAQMHTLILGSMPGVRSLQAQQYYAHPHNAFWPILSGLLGIKAACYAARLSQLQQHGIGLWDVLASCERTGSLDSAIQPQSLRVNDFAPMLTRHPELQRIIFNGSTAYTLWRRHVHALLPASPAVQLIRAPSTSPAHAAMSLHAKREAWQLALQGHPRHYSAP